MDGSIRPEDQAAAWNDISSSKQYAVCSMQYAAADFDRLLWFTRIPAASILPASRGIADPHPVPQGASSAGEGSEGKLEFYENCLRYYRPKAHPRCSIPTRRARLNVRVSPKSILK